MIFIKNWIIGYGKRKRDLLGRFYFLVSVFFFAILWGAFLIKQLFHSSLLDMRLL